MFPKLTIPVWCSVQSIFTAQKELSLLQSIVYPFDLHYFLRVKAIKGKVE